MKASYLLCGRGIEARDHSLRCSTFQASTWQMVMHDSHIWRVWLFPSGSLHSHPFLHRQSHQLLSLQFSWFHLCPESRRATHFLPSFLPLQSLPLLPHQPLAPIAPSRQSGSHSLLISHLMTMVGCRLHLLRKCRALRFRVHFCALIWLPAHQSRSDCQLKFRLTFKIAE